MRPDQPRERGAQALRVVAVRLRSALERRVVLSQYLMRVNYAGDFPPSETGLTHITWYGKHNSEMYFWHAAQFYQWGHPELLERGLGWYREILPRAQAAAAARSTSL